MGVMQRAVLAAITGQFSLFKWIYKHFQLYRPACIEYLHTYFYAKWKLKHSLCIKKIGAFYGCEKCCHAFALAPLISAFKWGTVSSFSSTGIKDTVQSTSVLTKASVSYEIRVLWVKINHVKSHSKTLTFTLNTDINQIFQMRYCMSS